MISRLSTLFGILALLLASVGLYGVTAYSVAQRTPDIGIRMALGAERGGVIAMVIRGGNYSNCSWAGDRDPCRAALRTICEVSTL
jgi:hypothetical protein